VPDASGGGLPLPTGTDPTSAAAPVLAALAPVGAATTSAAGSLCDAVGAVGAVPNQVGTAAFLAAAPKLPPQLTSALVPVLASAASNGVDPAEVCSMLTGVVTGVVGGVVGTPAGGGATPAGAGTASPAANEVAATPSGSSGGSTGGGASLAFTGAQSWMLALAGLLLALLGAALLRARRLVRAPGRAA
jgi:hypothetical protein